MDSVFCGIFRLMYLHQFLYGLYPSGYDLWVRRASPEPDRIVAAFDDLERDGLARRVQQ